MYTNGIFQLLSSWMGEREELFIFPVPFGQTSYGRTPLYATCDYVMGNAGYLSEAMICDGRVLNVLSTGVCVCVPYMCHVEQL